MSSKARESKLDDVYVREYAIFQIYIQISLSTGTLVASLKQERFCGLIATKKILTDNDFDTLIL